MSTPLRKLVGAEGVPQRARGGDRLPVVIDQVGVGGQGVEELVDNRLHYSRGAFRDDGTWYWPEDMTGAERARAA